MADVQVEILDQSGANRTQAQLPDDVPMQRLIPALVTKMKLPATHGGQPVVYELDHKRSGKRLGPNDTLRGAGVQPGDTLRILPRITAG